MIDKRISVSTKTANNISVIVIMLLAALMRLFHYADWSLSNDELSALNRLRFDGFFEMILLGARHDGHPAGVQAMLWWWTHLFGNNPALIRLPFVIFGTLAVYYIFLIGKKFFGTNTALFAAATFAFLEYPILYSQIARPYSPGLLFSLMNIYYWSILVFDKQRKNGHYFAFALSAVLAAYTHYFSFLLVFIVGLSGFVFYRRLNLSKYLGAAFLVFVLYIPHLEIFFYQLSLGGVGGPEGWLGKPGKAWVFNYLWYAFNESAALVVLLLAVFSISLFWRKPKITRFHILAAFWFVIVFIIGFTYSVSINPVLQYSVLLFVFPLVTLLVFSLINQKPNKYISLLVLAYLALGCFHTIEIKGFYQKQHFGEFKGVAEKIAQWNSELGKENISSTIVVNAPYYINFYLDTMAASIEIKKYEYRTDEYFIEFEKALDLSQSQHYIYAWTKPAPEEIHSLILKRYPKIMEQVNYSGLSEVTLYSKNPDE